MRNLKRALSLALASVMVMGMMVVGTSAAGYKDVEAFEDNIEAIEVLQAVGIMVGDDNGNFNPDAKVTRNEMAVIMSNLLNLDYDYYRGINKFSDVPAWAAPYVAACAAEGVTGGIGNGLYGGSNNVTASQAALMIMKALGYFQHSEDFGEDWQVATVRQASAISLFDGVNAKAEDALTRNQVAQLVLNGLEADMVTFTGDVGSKIIINGFEYNAGYRAEYSSRTSTEKKYNTLKVGKTDISNQGQYYIQLGEELYNGKLTKRADTDAFERPATTWRYDAKTIGTYADTPDASYTAGVKVGTIYNDLGLTKGIADEDTTVYEDGALVGNGHTHADWTGYDIVKGQTDKIGGNGALTQVYYDDEDNSVIITVINTYVAEIASVRAETSTRDAYVTLDVSGTYTKPANTIVSSYETDEFAKEDVVRYTYSLKSGENAIQSMALADKVTGTMSTYTTAGSVTVDGVKYDGNTKSASNIANFASTVDKKSDVSVYLDEYGYGLYVDADTSVDYAVVLKYSASTGDWNDTAKAKLLFTDGTTETVEVELNDGTTATGTFGDVPNANQLSKYDIVSYTVDSDKVYTLTLVADAVAGNTGIGSFTLVNGATLFNIASGNAANVASENRSCNYADGKTIFLVADTSGSKTTYSVYEGIANVPTIKHNGGAAGAVAVFAKRGDTVAKVVFVEKNDKMSMTTDNKDVIYIKGSSADRSYNSDLGYFYEYDAYVNGEAQRIRVTTDVAEHTLVYGPAYNSKGLLVLANCEGYVNNSQRSDNGGLMIYAVGTDSVTNDVVKLGGSSGTQQVPYSCVDIENVYVMTVDGELEPSDIKSLALDTNDQVFFKLNDKGRLTDVYVKVVDVPTTVTPGAGTYSAVLEKGTTPGNLKLTVSSTDSSSTTSYSVKVYAYKLGEKDKAESVLTVTGTLSGGTYQHAPLISNTANDQMYYAVITMSTGESITTDSIIGG